MPGVKKSKHKNRDDVRAFMGQAKINFALIRLIKHAPGFTLNHAPGFSDSVK